MGGVVKFPELLTYIPGVKFGRASDWIKDWLMSMNGIVRCKSLGRDFSLVDRDSNLDKLGRSFNSFPRYSSVLCGSRPANGDGFPAKNVMK